MQKKNILVLSTTDEKGYGHGWSIYEKFKDLGLNTDYVCLTKSDEKTKKYFIDLTGKWSFSYLFYKLCVKLSKLPFVFHKSAKGMYKGLTFANAQDVLDKIDFTPDYIIICTYHFFLSPKSIYQLWKQTGATIVLNMCDEKLISGGCPYPINCDGYKSGCNNCPRYSFGKWIPQYIYAEKTKYFSPIPLHLVGTRYDLEKTIFAPFLAGKKQHISVAIPKMPIIMSKAEAREFFGIDKKSFVIMVGAVSVDNPIKGFKELMQSINIFSQEITNRPVVLFVLGRNIPQMNIPANIKLLTPGFLDFIGLSKAYYACDIFASSSIIDSGPMMVNYAFACGRPVVSFEVGIALDLVIKGETGWLAKLKDTQDFAKGLSYFYSQPQECMTRFEINCKNRMKHFAENPWYNFIIQ